MFASQKLHSSFSVVCLCMRRASTACIRTETWSKTGKLIQLKNIGNSDRSSSAGLISCLRLQFRCLNTAYTGVQKPMQERWLLSCIGNNRSFTDFSQPRKYNSNGDLSELVYEKLAEETLEHLSDFFEELGDSHDCPAAYDVTYGDGVLTVKFGAEHGTYVINKQTPNKQIWLSSPSSGPKRYDHIDNKWIYKHDSKALHDLLTEEISQILQTNVDFTRAELTER
ncbi:frataxin, mitochondrial-like [Amphiura filiformis]|uniref:frataxin, mitochondrial-like n=1 Tax=Amphiura filiformis TaxID=82378 RepID=UPI003B22799E